MTVRAAPEAISYPNFLSLPPMAEAAGLGICVVGIGASAGGLEAAKKLVHALPAASGLAFILVQHLDPTHESMMVDLLSRVSPVPVVQAEDGMVVVVDRLYVIPPGVYLSFEAGILHLSAPLAPQGARLPFDFLLQSLATSIGARAICVILSGSGADGTVGLEAIKAAGGLVIVQEPTEAGYDGMPRSAIATEHVDFILPVQEIAKKLADYRRYFDTPDIAKNVPQLITLIRERTGHDFSLYKPGTLLRRIARRMAMAGIGPDDAGSYLAVLQRDEIERALLVDDLLINVTSFFRDSGTFEMLSKTIVPELVAALSASDKPVRIWIAGCSTGEETYSITMLFLEHFSAIKAPAKLQIFSSDVDAKAVKFGRDGLYPATIEGVVSAERLARFFVQEPLGYRISSELRDKVTFVVQDVLTDPPFSKLDLICCRNLLIYLRPEAQAKIISIFNFALRKDGLLLLGSAETIGNPDARFDIVSKTGRLFRKTADGGKTNMPVSISSRELMRGAAVTEQPRAISRATDIAEFCKRLVLSRRSPATILINPKFECLYSSGPTELYLRVAPGYPTHDVLAMIRPSLRARVKAAIAEANNEDKRVVIPGGSVTREGRNLKFEIDVCPVVKDGERLFLICFIDHPRTYTTHSPKVLPDEVSRVAELERELIATQTELQSALRSLDAAKEDQKAVNEEALSANEEFQSTNEELVTSKEELQSLNEELTALNTQLQETLEHSRTTSDDLQNVLYSTDVATLFLDTKLNIRFFTPPIRALFTLIASDVGRPLSDFHSISTDVNLSIDALNVLKTSTPIERQIQTESGSWFSRRILPYRTHNGTVAGIVMTFVDITERKVALIALEESRLEAERANIAKTRFLAAASHDLRQPLQTMTLLNRMLTKVPPGASANRLLAKLDDTTSAMTGILNTLLDINQIDAGIVQADMADYPIGDLLHKLATAFIDLAESRGLKLHFVPSSLIIRTDPRILEQMLRNLISNALKYTEKGGILLGCRRHGKNVEMQVCDSGLGIPASELAAIFDEYHQVDNPARERSRGLGLGLSIVQRLGIITDHKVGVRSLHGKGSVFSIEAPIVETALIVTSPAVPAMTSSPLPDVPTRSGKILVIEDDPDIRQLLEMFLTDEGHEVATVRDGHDAIALITPHTNLPDLILSDYNLPNGGNGLEVTKKLREMIGHAVAVVIVTGDISSKTAQDIADANCARLNKPMKLSDLNNTIQYLLTDATSFPAPKRFQPKRERTSDQATIFVVDDDAAICSTMSELLEGQGYHVETFATGEAFLSSGAKPSNACLLLDANLPGMSGFELLNNLPDSLENIQAIMITGQGDTKLAVQAIKSGAFDFIEKPVGQDVLLAAISRALERSKDAENMTSQRQVAAAKVASLTTRQRQIMHLVLAGEPSKIIAEDLGISQRTVENHRASIMEKTGTKSLPALARLALTAVTKNGIPNKPQ